MYSIIIIIGNNILHFFTCTAQNQWLRQNVIDPHGNFLFCQECIIACLGVHSERLHKQRVIKQKQKDQPIVSMMKSEVTEAKLDKFVLRHDDSELQTFSVWWQSLADEQEVEVQFPHARHGLCGRYVQLLGNQVYDINNNRQIMKRR